MANHPHLQRMMLITFNIVCMSLSRICNAFGVNHVGRIFCIAELTTCHFDVLLICETRSGEKIRVPSKKKVSTPILAVVPFIRALEFAYRLILLQIFVFFLMHIPNGFAAYIFFRGVQAVQRFQCTFLRLGMRMVQRNKCMMC